MNIYDDSVNKNILLLNGAGSNYIYNPIVIGMPFKIRAVFNESVSSIIATIDNNSFTMVQDPENPNIYEYSLVAGSSSFSYAIGNHTIKISFVSESTGDKTVWEKFVGLAWWPDDAIQVYNAVSKTWINVNANKSWEVPVVCQQCPVRFFNSYSTPTGVKTFGGVRFVSILDVAQDEEDKELGTLINDKVLYDLNRDIRQVSNIYLVKSVVGVQETHQIKFVFRSELGMNGVTIPATLKTTACFARVIYDPTTY